MLLLDRRLCNIDVQTHKKVLSTSVTDRLAATLQKEWEASGQKPLADPRNLLYKAIVL